MRFNERIRLAGKLVDDATLIAALEDCERANAGETITYFEITTAAAFKLFAETPADWLLLEVGLGGRFDSTNVIEHPVACVVTPVSIDHAEFLGDTIESIAGEKAGIFKAGAQGVIGFQSERALTHARRRGATDRGDADDRRRSRFFRPRGARPPRLRRCARPARSSPAAPGRPTSARECGDGHRDAARGCAGSSDRALTRLV